jgi:DNA-binding XRE family transcriptional regulator
VSHAHLRPVARPALFPSPSIQKTWISTLIKGRVGSQSLIVDARAKQAYRQIIGGLQTARVEAHITQNCLAEYLPVRNGKVISEWETYISQPTLNHLIEWAAILDQRLVIRDRFGNAVSPARQNAGEEWCHYERRRMALPLRERRVALGLSQKALGHQIGVFKDTIMRWELAHHPPLPIVKILWAHALDNSLGLRPVRSRRHNQQAMRQRNTGVFYPDDFMPPPGTS